MIERANNRPLCVLGIMTNAKGLEIADEMLEWLAPVFEVHAVRHDGSQFELPALLEAQRLARLYHEPVLYLHTRGAVNTWKTTVPTRRMWREEFGRQWCKYFLFVKSPFPSIACPFVDDKGETRYNGFVANWQAWDMLELKPTKDRMDYERLWVGKPASVVGLLIDRHDNAIKEVRQYLYRNYGD